MPQSRVVYKQHVEELLQTAALVYTRWKIIEANHYKSNSEHCERDVTSVLVGGVVVDDQMDVEGLGNGLVDALRKPRNS